MLQFFCSTRHWSFSTTREGNLFTHAVAVQVMVGAFAPIVRVKTEQRKGQATTGDHHRRTHCGLSFVGNCHTLRLAGRNIGEGMHELACAALAPMRH